MSITMDKVCMNLRFLADVQGNKIDAVKALIEVARADVNTQDADGFTALMIAVQNVNVEMIDILIKAGADVNKRDIDGFTALMRCKNLHLSMFRVIARTLIEAGADVNARNKAGKSLFEMITHDMKLQIYEFISNNVKFKSKVDKPTPTIVDFDLVIGHLLVDFDKQDEYNKLFSLPCQTLPKLCGKIIDVNTSNYLKIGDIVLCKPNDNRVFLSEYTNICIVDEADVVAVKKE